MELNKRNSFFNTNIELLKYLVKRENPDICFFTESNSKPEDDLEASFPEYDIIHKQEDNHPLDRSVALIKKNKISYEHMTNLCERNIASIWLRVKIDHKKYISIGGYYRQWRLPQECGDLTSGSTKSQISRLKAFINQAKKAIKMTKHCLIIGDVNIDKSVSRDQFLRPELKDLLPIYDDFLNESNLSILNKDHTRFESFCPSSLIDHIVTNLPSHVDQIMTSPSIISDHMVISCLLHSKELIQNEGYLYKMEWWRLSP